ncbi:MAG: hypothetical protein GY737_05665, partial [Desulfobacteraceae bacterium]|nr:hypothetical protein [Desulfobacteraceae bacterium]
QKANYEQSMFRAATAEARRVFSAKHTFKIDPTTGQPDASLPKSIIDILVKQKERKKERQERRENKLPPKSSRTWEPKKTTIKDAKTNRNSKRVSFGSRPRDRNDSESSVASITQEKVKPERVKTFKREEGSPARKKAFTCHNCGKEGHFKCDCTEPLKRTSTKVSTVHTS